jgi:TRAP-type mannitol/chloroaromatic compound transport system permease small subunit
MHIIDKISEWSGKIASYVVLIIMIVLIYEVILRTFFGKPTLWGYETAGMLFGAYCMVVGAYTHRHDAHVRMDVLYGRWEVRTKARVEIFTSFLTIAFLAVFLWKAVQNAWESWAMLEYSGSAWGPPVFPLKTVICIGVLLLLLQSVVHFIKNLVVGIKGRGHHV